MRKIIPLNFDWFVALHQEEHLEKVDLSTFDKISIPHHGVEIPFNNFNEKMLQTVLSYAKELFIEEDDEGKVIKLKFEGVAHEARVYVNSEFVFEHRGGYTPFDVDITNVCKYGEKNQILVVVDSREDTSIPPFGGVVDYLGYSGIYREVSLIVTNKMFIKSVFVQTDGSSELKVEVSFSQANGEFELLVFKGKEKVAEVSDVKVYDTTMIIPTTIKNPTLWSLDTPVLYDVVIRYKANDKLIDEVSYKFGIRSAVFKEDGFYLNGEKIKLLGLNRHQSYPYVGYAMPKSAQYEDADILKYDLGVNIVRTAHYPQSKHFLDRCDEIGLLVFEEIPGWQHIGNDQWQALSAQNLRDMIIRDRNHPSIVLWGVRINESPDDHDFYFKTNGIARALDPTRQTGGVRNIEQSEFLEDVYTFNDFSHRGNNKGLKDKSNVTKKVPYLVTEYNGHMFPTKRYDDETHRLDHALRHLNVINEMLTPDNNMSGCIGWVMNDYNTHQEFGSGDRVCYHGVLDMFRIPKLAGQAYAAQNSIKPVLVISSTMNIGEYAAGELSQVFVFTNADYVKLYRNEQYVGTFKPNHKTYMNLPHPPIVIDDFIGETLMVNEEMSHKDAEIAKSILNAIGKYGSQLPLRIKLKVLYILKKYKLTYDQGVKMFYKYMSGWGTDKTGYKFEGYIKDELVKTVYKENNETFEFLLDVKSKELHIEDTYDVTRCVVSKINQKNEIIPYSFDPISIKVTGSIELIGPSEVSLQSGVIAFWVKTKSKGKGKITITTGNKILSEEVVVS